MGVDAELATDFDGNVTRRETTYIEGFDQLVVT